jgi:DNA invertase Pin-like site-specific DNA recombinase
MAATLAYSYIRFSNPQQAEGDSLRRQTERAAAYCRRRGLTLDTSLTLHDLGVSAFRGANAAVGNFRTFLEAVRAGRVPEGSVLIVESFDRISRQGIDEGYDLIKSILKSGVRIATLSPEREFDREAVRSLSRGALEIQIILERAAEESERKSDRVGAAWRRKQKDAAGGAVMTRRLPGWVTVNGDGRLALVPAKVKAVRAIFRLALGGANPCAIARHLNARRVPVLGRRVYKGRPVVWGESLVRHFLTSRSVLGEYQPCRNGEPSAPAVPDYYPAVVEPDDFYRVQAMVRPLGVHRRGRKGAHVNLFAGLLRVAGTGASLVYNHVNGKAAKLTPSAPHHGRGGKWCSYPAAPFERGILSRLREVKASDVAPEGEGPAARVEAAAARLAEAEELVTAWTRKMDNPALIEVVAAKLVEFGEAKKKLAAELAEAQQEAASPLSESWGGFRSLAALLGDDGGDKELREKVKVALRRAVESVHCLFLGRGRLRLAAVRVQFRGASDAHRDYLLGYDPGRSNQRVRRPGRWWVRSFAECGIKGTLDLRDAAHVARLERFLTTVVLPAG